MLHNILHINLIWKKLTWILSQKNAQGYTNHNEDRVTD